MGQTEQMATDQAQAAAGRHIALSIVLDGRLAVPELAGISRLAARLGFGVWWRQPPLAGSAVASTDAVIGALLAAMPGAAPADAPDGSGGSGEAGEPDRGDAPSRTGGVDGPGWPSAPSPAGLIVKVGQAGGPALAVSVSDAFARGARLALAGETGPVADLLRARPGLCGPRVAVGHRVHALHWRPVASCAVFVAASPARDVAAEPGSTDQFV
jgi:hypothetical protein